MRFRYLPKFLLLVLVALAVFVNFTRPPPVNFEREGKAGYTAQTRVSASVSEAKSTTTPNKNKKHCPCPTEIENADCDEGTCPVGFICTNTAQSCRFDSAAILFQDARMRGPAIEPGDKPPKFLS